MQGVDRHTLYESTLSHPMTLICPSQGCSSSRSRFRLGVFSGPEYSAFGMLAAFVVFDARLLLEPITRVLRCHKRGGENLVGEAETAKHLRPEHVECPASLHCVSREHQRHLDGFFSFAAPAAWMTRQDQLYFEWNPQGRFSKLG